MYKIYAFIPAGSLSLSLCARNMVSDLVPDGLFPEFLAGFVGLKNIHGCPGDEKWGCNMGIFKTSVLGCIWNSGEGAAPSF